MHFHHRNTKGLIKYCQDNSNLFSTAQDASYKTASFCQREFIHEADEFIHEEMEGTGQTLTY